MLQGRLWQVLFLYMWNYRKQSVLPGQLLTLEMWGVNIIGRNFKCVLGRLTETEGISMSERGKALIQTEKELDFAIFCIENIAIHLGVEAEKVYEALTVKSDILNGYIVPCYDVLHTQGKEYIVEDIVGLMKERGVEL